MWEVRDVECLELGMFRDVRCLGCLLGYGMLFYKMPNRNGGLMFYDLYISFISFHKTELLNISNITMKLIEELKNLLF